jgi:hypothetical protein
MGKVESDNAKLIRKDAEENERNIRKRKEEREEESQAVADKLLLAERRASGKKAEKKSSGKKAATPRKEAKKKVKLTPTAKRIKERYDDHEKKNAKKEKEIGERRAFLIAEGLTTVKVLDDDESELGDDDMEWTEDQFEVVDHMVDWKTAKGHFRVVIGMRAGRSESTEMWMWGQRTALLLDGVDKSKLDACIQENCDHSMIVEKPKIKKPCNHSSYGLGVLYNADPEVNPGWCAPGKFLFGVKCAGCGSPFVQKAPPKGGGKKPGEPQVPSTTNPVCCCNNLRNQNGALEEGCSHANCKCFVGMTPFSRHQRVMGQGRPGEAFSPTPSLWSRLCKYINVCPKNRIQFASMR